MTVPKVSGSLLSKLSRKQYYIEPAFGLVAIFAIANLELIQMDVKDTGQSA
jgi:hypothetical protein